MKARGNQNASECVSLTVGKEYVVVGLSKYLLRVVDDFAEPILFDR